MKKFLKRLLAGLGIGVGCAIPGVSGGTIAIILNVYEDLVSAVSNLFKKFKESIIVLIPILIGVIGALIPCIILFDKLFDCCLFLCITVFAGLMIGSLPKITDEVKGQPVNKKCIIVCIICFLIVISIGICSVFLGDKIDLKSHFINPEWWFYILMIPIGMIGSIALVVPGVSGSMILLILGVYNPLIEIAAALLKGQSTNIGGTIGIIICFAVGVIVGFFLMSKLMNHLLNKHHLITMWGVIGFVVGSIITLFFNNTIYSYYQKMAGNIPSGESAPWLSWQVELIIGIILLLAFAVLSYLLIRYLKKNAQN